MSSRGIPRDGAIGSFSAWKSFISKASEQKPDYPIDNYIQLGKLPSEMALIT